MGENPVVPLARDERIPEGTSMSDASLGVTNPGYANLEGDTTSGLYRRDQRIPRDN